MNRLQQLHDAGQSIWFDYIDRTMLGNGELERRIRDDALTGMTSNPTIFEKALAEGHAYDDQLRSEPAGLSARELFERVAVDDVRSACDIFAGVYERTGRKDGFVSLEVSPEFAHDSHRTIEEARRLWSAVDRPNVMIKVPGTPEGVPAVRQLLAEGLNVNVTLLFSLEAYERIIEAYLGALEDRHDAGHPLREVASVASFFVSRVDSEVDRRLQARMDRVDGAGRDRLRALQGRAAIANAKLAYRLFQERFAGPRWERLAEAGAEVQRPLWASTSTKNPGYRDVMYVEELIGPETVNIMPPATIEAFRDHGETRRSVDDGYGEAERVLRELEGEGIPLPEVTTTLLREGVDAFARSYASLLAGLEGKLRELGREPAGAR